MSSLGQLKNRTDQRSGCLGPALGEQLTGNISAGTAYSMVGVNHVLRPLWLLTKRGLPVL
jgi:hypothetical protein